MTNSDLIKQLFNTNFNSFKDKKIVIYGLSAGTQAVIEGSEGFNIIGLLDGIKTDGEMYGKRILSITECNHSNTDIIVIVARKATTRIIKKRIISYCQTEDIKLYDIYGIDLSIDDCNYSEMNTYFEQTSEKLKAEIDKHDVISFDIFDTLLMRKVLLPRDVFEYMALTHEFDFDFVSERIKAEQELLKNTNPTIEEIYRFLSDKYDINASEIMNIELSVEKSMLIPRQDMVDILNYSICQGKIVYIVSDMYLHSKMLSEILFSFGITGYKDILVSCEHRVSKCNGLFDILKSKSKGNKILHIGDNEEADGESATVYGLDSFLIKSAVEMMYISSMSELNEVNYMSSYNSRLHVGLFLSRAFNSPFALSTYKGKMTIDNCQILGKFIAPLITEFVLWLEHLTREDECQTVLLAARDGSLIKKCCHNFESSDKYVYFLTSRSSAICSTISDWNDIEKLLKLPYTGMPNQMLKNRFLLPETDIEPYNQNDSVYDYVYKHKERIIQNCKRMKDNYMVYIKNNNIDFSKKIAFFDFVSSGSAQLGLEKIMNTKLYGYYFIHVFDDNPQKRELSIKAMGGSGLSFGITNNLYDKYIFLENILTSEMPTLKEFDEQGNPHYCVEYRSEEDIYSVLSIQESITDYFKEFIKYSSKYNLCFDIVDKILGLLDGSKNIINQKLLESLVLKDDFNGTLFESKSMVQ